LSLDYFEKRRRRKFLAAALVAGIVASSLAYLVTGIVDVSAADCARILLARIPFLRNLAGAEAIDPTKVTIVELIRLPRIAAGLLVGSGLAVAGAAYQGLFRNQLADPFMTGVSAGATFGCALALLLGFTGGAFGLGGITLFSFLGALATALAIFSLIGLFKRVSSLTILLIGIAVNLFLSSLVSFLMFMNRDKIETIILWTMGSVAGATWDRIIFSLPFFLAGCAGLLLCARPLDYLVLGSDIARVHGYSVRKYQFLVILFSSLVASSCVSLSGIIGFVGLVTPNVARALFGFRHRDLFVFSFLFGALFFTFADFLSRTLMAPSEIPAGIMTSLVGVPVFLFLIYRKRKEGE